MEDQRATVDPGSYRDPLSQVHLLGDRVLRVLRGRGVDDYRTAAVAPSVAAAIDRGDVVATWEPDDRPLPLEDETESVIEHERLEVISYPYEWSHSMLKDAALLTLRLTGELLDDGMVLKDATPYNVQFDGARPRFIDVGSFERLPPGEPWYGYHQFCQLFLYPLWLRSSVDVSFRPWLRGSIDGIAADDVVRLIGRRRWRTKGFGVHGWYHARAIRKHAATDRVVKDELRSAGFGPGVIRGQLTSLRKAVTASTWTASDSTWSDYGDRAHYSDADLGAKEAFVASALDPRIARVLDLGCNDGHFSRLCAADGRRVIAVDSDELVIERLYRQLSSEDERRITPLVMDLADPSPSMGWRSIERPALAERARPDLVLALAIVHHLAITDTVPLDDIVAMLADLGGETIVEFPLPEDPMVQRLLRNKRRDLFAEYSVESFEKAIGRHFVTQRSERLPSGLRHIYHLRPGR